MVLSLVLWSMHYLHFSQNASHAYSLILSLLCLFPYFLLLIPSFTPAKAKINLSLCQCQVNVKINLSLCQRQVNISQYLSILLFISSPPISSPPISSPLISVTMSTAQSNYSHLSLVNIAPTSTVDNAISPNWAMPPFLFRKKLSPFLHLPCTLDRDQNTFPLLFLQVT